jgi:hypothetical protein
MSVLSLQQLTTGGKAGNIANSSNTLLEEKDDLNQGGLDIVFLIRILTDHSNYC